MKTTKHRPRLAAFPKCFLSRLMGQYMTVFEWIDLAATIPHLEGIELYPYQPALDSWDPKYLRQVKQAVEDRGLEIPMLCASPDFTQPEQTARYDQVDYQLQLVDVAAELGASYLRVLSGQRRPGVSREDGIKWTVECIEEVLPHAFERDVILIMENHYKDGFWQYPEFAQARDIYLEIVGRIEHPNFALNYDPSNALIAGDDPYELLEAMKNRVVTMHASDRSLEGGTLEDLRRLDRDAMTGYAGFVKHGVIGQGLIDYDRIFNTLKGVGFTGWISIEDGEDPFVGIQHLSESAEFLVDAWG